MAIPRHTPLPSLLTSLWKFSLKMEEPDHDWTLSLVRPVAVYWCCDSKTNSLQPIITRICNNVIEISVNKSYKISDN